MCYSSNVLVSITAPQVNQRGSQYKEKAFSSILDSIDEHDSFQLEYSRHEDGIGLFLRFPDSLERHIIPHVKAKYSNCSFIPVDEPSQSADSSVTWSVSLMLSPELRPILRHKQFQDLIAGAMKDPLESLLGVIQSDDELKAHIQITLRPASRARR